jgi:hypothetical protein
MGRLLTVISFILIAASELSGVSCNPDSPCSYKTFPGKQDTIPDKQLLYNGRIWRNLYSNIRQDEFLFTNEWLNGDVVINDMKYTNLPLRYDIYNDQLIIMINQGTFIQLNKELIKSFTLSYKGKVIFFENFGNISGSSLRGFGQLLYKGEICFILKQIKQIKELAVENKYDEFYQTQVLYILKDGVFNRVSGKKDLLNVLSDKDKQLQNYIRENKIRIRKKYPESFIPVIIFYDKLK